MSPIRAADPIGEALAVLWQPGRPQSRHRRNQPHHRPHQGEGLIRTITKSEAGQRLLNWAVAVLRTRHAANVRHDAPVIPDTYGGHCDPSNSRRALRTALPPIGSTARRDLGPILRGLRSAAGMSPTEVASLLT